MLTYDEYKDLNAELIAERMSNIDYEEKLIEEEINREEKKNENSAKSSANEKQADDTISKQMDISEFPF